MQKNVIRRLFEIERRNLTCHVHGNPALKSKHHVFERPAQAVDLVEVKPFLQHHGHAEHPLFWEFRICRHLCHGHVAIHDHRLVRFGDDGSLQEIELAFHHLIETEIRFRGGHLKRYGRDLPIIEMDCFDVIVQVEFVEIGQKARHGVVFVIMVSEQPLHQHLIPCGTACKLLF